MSFDFQQFLIRAASIDELLSAAYQPKTGQKDNTDQAALRLAAWCRSASSGDWSLFFKRLARDNLSVDEVLSRFADIRDLPEAQQLPWFTDAQWIYQALVGRFGRPEPFLIEGVEPRPFEKLFYALVETAETQGIASTSERARALFNESARTDLRCGLLKSLTDLYAPLLYSTFVETLKKQTSDNKLPPSKANASTYQFDRFIEDLRATELTAIFTEKPVLLRLTATLVRQWIDTTTELIARLDSDIAEIKAVITHSDASIKVRAVQGDLSDPHNFGHSVQIITFEDRTKVVYKPKDLRLDVVWHELIAGFNASSPPVALKSAKTIACREYGWTEFIEHTSCESAQDFELFYRRSGAWLAIFHVFASSDMHFENILAHGAHPVPIDLEMILQASTPETEQQTAETAAQVEAHRVVRNSVLMVGMLPTYVKSPNNKIVDVGGLNAVKSSAPVGMWKNTNTDGMRWIQIPNDSAKTSNAPHINGRYAQLGDYLPACIEGFERYAHFLLKQRDSVGIVNLLAGFKKLPVRKVIRNTRFYHILLQRLKDHRHMGDGVTWSAQADFLSRLADWNSSDDLLWPLQETERVALINLNVPHFVSLSDDDQVSNIKGHLIQTHAMTGLERAAERLTGWCIAEIQRQVEIITVSTSFVSRSGHDSEGKYLFKRKLRQSTSTLDSTTLTAEAARIVETILQYGTIKDKSAAWVGIDWLGNSEFGQLVTLGPDLYNGSSGIALFLAAYARYANDPVSRELAFKALAATRLQFAQPSAPRLARGLGIGGASGLGSVVYALTVISDLLDDPSLLQDALMLSNLFSNELISADRSLDVIAGSAGGILGLLALYRKTQSNEVLAKAIACGEHLLRQPRQGDVGKRSWTALGISETPLTGFSHGAAGFAYALSALAASSDRADFAQAAQECFAHEDSCYDKTIFNWPDLRGAADRVTSLSQWCHGAVGIGLARIASSKSDKTKVGARVDDINHAVQNTTQNWPQRVDTLCCGTLGTIEFLAEAGEFLKQPTLSSLSDQRLAQIIVNSNEQDGYVWNTGGAAFNLGLFRGLSGLGYTILRKLDRRLPNVLLWE